MISTPLRRSITLRYIVVASILFMSWLAYGVLWTSLRVRPLRRTIARLEIVQGKAQFKQKPRETDLIPAAA